MEKTLVVPGAHDPISAQKIEPKAIRRTMLFTVGGEKDDICAVGHTLAAHDLCTSLRPYRKRHHMQAGEGAGRRFGILGQPH